MDLRMPGMDGIEATKQIRQIDPEAKIIALTSYDGDQGNLSRARSRSSRIHSERIGSYRNCPGDPGGSPGKRLMSPEVGTLERAFSAGGAHGARD
jgi:CheY-like chemotaxis protein